MRWVALFGTAITLMLSLWMFIDYKAPGFLPGRLGPWHSECPCRGGRFRAPRKVTADGTHSASDSDWVGRRPWIRSSKSTTTWASTKPLRGERIDDDAARDRNLQDAMTTSADFAS